MATMRALDPDATYATMTDQDLSAIVAYLRTVPPKE